MEWNRQNCALLTLCTACGYVCFKILRLQQELEAQKRQTHAERKGRTKAEQRLRVLSRKPLLGSTITSRIPGSDNENETSNPSMAKPDLSGASCRPIGFMKSPFNLRVGTPRQSGVVSSALSTLEFVRAVNPSASLDGISEFSHLWVIYLFHENTNYDKEEKILDKLKGDASKAPPFQGLVSKITPPRCPNLKVGVFSCRSPHRPNPIGLSLAEIVKVDEENGTIVLKGLDLLDGTPVIDIKPYLPQFESHPQATVPDWVRASFDVPRMDVEWAPEALERFNALQVELHAFENKDALRGSIEDTLSLDIRSPFQKKKHKPTGLDKRFFTGDLHFQGLQITYNLVQVKHSDPGEKGECLEQHCKVRIFHIDSMKKPKNEVQEFANQI